jgi:hypothetical protein
MERGATLFEPAESPLKLKLMRPIGFGIMGGSVTDVTGGLLIRMGSCVFISKVIASPVRTIMAYATRAYG